MTPRDVVKRTVRFENPGRLAVSLPEAYGSDFSHVGIAPSPDARPSSGVDEWGAVWSNMGTTNLGEVKRFPLTSWDLWPSLEIPDITEPRRWQALDGARRRAGDRFLLASGVSLYERVHFLRGLENAWVDIHENPGKLGELIDVLVEMNLYAIERFAEAGCDGLLFCDDWGLQHGLMISPESWRAIWKPRYARVYAAAHEAGLLTFLHSCGDILSILDDLIDAGLDVIQMDQQLNMGLDALERYAGRITFWNPVDIQAVMPTADERAIAAYCREMVRRLGRPEGGFIAKWYPSPESVGHSPAAIAAMSETFLAINADYETFWRSEPA